MHRGIKHSRRALRRSLLRLAWRVNPSPWGEGEHWRDHARQQGMDANSILWAHARRHMYAVDALLDGERPTIDDSGGMWLGSGLVMRPVEPAVAAVVAVLESIGRELSTFAVDTTVPLAVLSERLVNAERSGVEADPTESPPAGIRSVAALCNAPRPGPAAALAA
jgi:hypothetical protein